MDGYIEKGAAITAIMSEPTDAHYQLWYADKIKSIPAVDAVPVVRCKDCIGQSTWFKEAETGCEICGMSGMYPKSEDGYCSYSLRRNNETD